MFQFPGFASTPYVFRCGYLIEVGCPIRTPRDQRLLAAPPRFSQRATSFVASWRQGIHQMPLTYAKNLNSLAQDPSNRRQASVVRNKDVKTPAPNRPDRIQTYAHTSHPRADTDTPAQKPNRLTTSA
jgi:hypothetical protein